VQRTGIPYTGDVDEFSGSRDVLSRARVWLDTLTGTGRKATLDDLTKQINADLRTLSPPMVEHLAAVARAMTRRGR
jgi:hypothetical protein